MENQPTPKIATTFIHESVRLRAADIGRRCEVLRNTRIEYSSLGDYSYLGENCEVADAVIGKFTAIANAVRIGAPNHPMDRPSQHALPTARNTTRLPRRAIRLSLPTGAPPRRSSAMTAGSAMARSSCRM